MIKKYISNTGIDIEVGYFFGSGNDEAVVSFEREGTKLVIWTDQGQYELTLKTGDYLSHEDGTQELIKSKHDKDE